MARFTEEWQVWIVASNGDIHVYIFQDEKEAQDFADKNPKIVIHEGGITSEEPTPVRKVTRHFDS